MEVNVMALARLKAERKEWKLNPQPGFKARPVTLSDSGTNYFKWECWIPGEKGTIWEGGLYRMVMEFPQEYPVRPPRCYFTPSLPHPNVYPSGTVCLSILNEEADWKPAISIKQILVGVQKLLDRPNSESPAQQEALNLLKKDRLEYNRRILEFAKTHPQIA